ALDPPLPDCCERQLWNAARELAAQGWQVGSVAIQTLDPDAARWERRSPRVRSVHKRNVIGRGLLGAARYFYPPAWRRRSMSDAAIDFRTTVEAEAHKLLARQTGGFVALHEREFHRSLAALDRHLLVWFVRGENPPS